MVDIFLAKSVNSMIYCYDDKIMFNKLSTESLLEFRKQMRNRYETIIVGANTIKNDNPRLLNENQNNIRIVIDKYCDLDIDSKIFSIKPEQTFLILLKNNLEYEECLKDKGVNVVKLKDYSDKNLIDKIREISIGNVLVEGGSKIISFLLENNFIDNIIMIEFPILFPKNSISLCNTLKNFTSLELKQSYVFDNKYIYSSYKILK